MPKEKSFPLGENSPNLVTLLPTYLLPSKREGWLSYYQDESAH
jgi:hypothetical protein